MSEVKEWMNTAAAHIREVMRHPSPDRAEDLRRETRIAEIIASHAPAEAAPDSVGSPQKPEFSAQAVADGWWEIYHDDDCGGIITPYPENLCLRCGMHPDLQSRGARRTSKGHDSVGEAPAAQKEDSPEATPPILDALRLANEWAAKFPLSGTASHADTEAAMQVYEATTHALELAAPTPSLHEAVAPTELTPHSSVVHTDLKVRCHDCGGHQIWRYLEDEDTIEVFHDCTGGKKAKLRHEAGRQEGWEAAKKEE